MRSIGKVWISHVKCKSSQCWEVRESLVFTDVRYYELSVPITNRATRLTMAIQ